MIGYSASALSQLYVYNATANASAGGIWQSGCGPSSDESGDVYAAIGNGTFDANIGGGVDFGDTMLRLGIRSSLFGLIDYFTPFNEASLQSVDHELGSAGMVILPDPIKMHPISITVGHFIFLQNVQLDQNFKLRLTRRFGCATVNCLQKPV